MGNGGSAGSFPECKNIKAESGIFKGHGTSYALLAGLNFYRFETKESDSLREAISDVKKMANLLDENRYCIDTVLGANVTLTNIRKELSAIAHAAQSTDRVMFYFSGHGLTYDSLKKFMPQRVSDSLLGSKTEKNLFYLLLYQSFPGLMQDCISLGEIADSLSTSLAMQKVIIIDACYSGTAQPPVIPPFNAYHYLLSDNGYYSLLTWNSQVREGLYTRAIIDGLQGKADALGKGNNDGKVDAFELSKYVDDTVGKEMFRGCGEPYRAVSVYIGSGNIVLTKTGKK
jgi:hypothetical protein